jgi:hypothetical protein
MRSLSLPSTTDSNKTVAVYRAVPTPVRMSPMVKIRNGPVGSSGISRKPTVEMVVTVW